MGPKSNTFFNSRHTYTAMNLARIAVTQNGRTTSRHPIIFVVWGASRLSQRHTDHATATMEKRRWGMQLICPRTFTLVGQGTRHKRPRALRGAVHIFKTTKRVSRQIRTLTAQNSANGQLVVSKQGPSRLVSPTVAAND